MKTTEGADPLAEELLGVSLQRYANVYAGLAEGFELDAVLENEGIEAPRWPAVDRAWTNRIADDHEAEARLHHPFDEALLSAQGEYARRIPPLDEDAKAFFDFIRVWPQDPEPLALLERLGLRPNDVIRLQRAWSAKMAADEALRKRVEEILMEDPGPLPEIAPEPARLPTRAYATRKKPAEPPPPVVEPPSAEAPPPLPGLAVPLPRDVEPVAPPVARPFAAEPPVAPPPMVAPPPVMPPPVMPPPVMPPPVAPPPPAVSLFSASAAPLPAPLPPPPGVVPTLLETSAAVVISPFAERLPFKPSAPPPSAPLAPPPGVVPTLLETSSAVVMSPFAERLPFKSSAPTPERPQVDRRSLVGLPFHPFAPGSGAAQAPPAPELGQAATKDVALTGDQLTALRRVALGPDALPPPPASSPGSSPGSSPRAPRAFEDDGEHTTVGVLASFADKVLPFAAAGAQAPAAPADPGPKPPPPSRPQDDQRFAAWRLEQYASLCAELAVFSSDTEATFKKYGLFTATDRAALDAFFRRRLSDSPAVYAEWQALYWRFRQHWSANPRR